MKLNAKPLHDAGVQKSTLAAITTAMGLKDPYTQDHACRVAVYASRLAQGLGLTPGEVENIWLGGLLHDIGKIGLSAKIFSNTHSRLSADMQAEVRRHPQIGAAILKNFDFQTPVIDFVHYHHEKMDGTGYPYRLKSDQIPLGAKIIRVADCFDAITTDRPYQQGKSCNEALVILCKISGTDLSPELVDAFSVEIKEKGLATIQTTSTLLYGPVLGRRI